MSDRRNSQFREIPLDVYRDKVMGCWLGKNAGGTLGGPLETKYGNDVMFDVWWYPELPEEGIPNDDLEMQLIWLQALQQRGPGITARDLAEYWTDCINYNFDEYGLSKSNLKLGLVPPVSGWHNNWFKDCMGSPIRSEIWACIAPGEPQIAAHYAFEDAICDHAGGESVFGEIFNAVMQSSAFFVNDKLTLIQLGLSAIPEDCSTFQAIAAAVDAHERGYEWKRAREELRKKFFNRNAQYSPLNLGFQTIGLLYGEDFGDAICKAVNCGWDTDCTGATVGATIGIIEGAKSLPDKWLLPLGNRIATNVGTGGIAHLVAPTDIEGLTEATIREADRVLTYWSARTRIIADGAMVNRAVLPAEITVRRQPPHRPDTIHWDLTSIQLDVRYNQGAAIVPNVPLLVDVTVTNPHPIDLDIEVSVDTPDGWSCDFEGTQNVMVQSETTALMQIKFSTEGDYIHESNRATMHIRIPERPELPSIPIVILGGSKWCISRAFPAGSIDTVAPFEPVKVLDTPPEGWFENWTTDNDLKLEHFFGGREGVLYVLHDIYSPTECPVILGVPNSNRMKLWLNGMLVRQTDHVVPLRPNLGSSDGDDANYADVTLVKGWNQVLIKFARGKEPVEAHFTIGGRNEHRINRGNAVLGLRRTQFRWEQSAQKQ